MAQPLDTIRSALANRYSIVRQLGAGGMATVYLADDLRHDRPVAIKVLHPEMAAAIGAERFSREIRLLAGLRHPFILPLHDSGEAGGLLYYVMPYIDGESLGARVGRRGRLEVAEAIAITREIADALSYAHSEGVVHRDVKPENILLSRQGHALLADFGIARRSVPDPTRADQVTAIGLAVGTPTYMSPEQVLGDEVDGTSDVYSLAATLYEMLAGRPPFVADSAGSLAALHLRAPVPTLAEAGVNAPSAVEAAIRRGLAKDPDERFHTAAEFAKALTTPDPTPATTVSTTAMLPEVSVVVLPLSNLSGDEQSEYLSDGITDELIGALARVGGLRVISRTSAYAFKGKAIPIREIGGTLKVDYAVEGGVRRHGDRLRVSAQLVRVNDDSSVWSERYERQVDDLFDVQDDIARRIAGTLMKTLRTAAATPPESVIKPRNVAAYEDYLLGRYHWNKRTREGLERALEHFRRAVATDPDYAPAHSGIADTIGVMVSSWFASPDQYPSAVTAAQRAIELDPNLPEAHASLGYLKLHAQWDWAGAEAELRRAIALNPSFVTARQWLSTYLASIGRREEAVSLAVQATSLDPLSILPRITLGTVHLVSSEYQEAERHFRRAVAMEPNFESAQTWLAIALAFQGKPEALERSQIAAELSASGPAGRNNHAFVLALLGKRDEAEALLREVRAAMETYPLFLSMVYAALDHDDEALTLLERAVEARSHWMHSVIGQPTFAKYRAHPRYLAALQRVGLPRA